jgi:hypothetical protein
VHAGSHDQPIHFQIRSQQSVVRSKCQILSLTACCCVAASSHPQLTQHQDTLQATCVCDNGISPNLTQYTQTLPYNICQQWGTNCVADCGIGENACADACRRDHPCGAQDPFKGNATSTSSGASHSATAKPTGSRDASSTIPITGFAGATTSPDAPGAASSLVGFGASYGLAVTLVGIFASLTLL